MKYKSLEELTEAQEHKQGVEDVPMEQDCEEEQVLFILDGDDDPVQEMSLFEVETINDFQIELEK